MKNSPLDVTPICLGIVLTLGCFLITGLYVEVGCLLAAFVVSISLVIYDILLKRPGRAGLPSLGIFLTTIGLTLSITFWFIVVLIATTTMRNSGAVAIPMFVLTALVTWLIFSLSVRKDGSGKRPRPIESVWRRLYRFLLTVRGMFVLVAVVATILWPIHLLRMRPTYSRIANDESVLGNLCDAESSLMAERAKLCRERSARGVPWDLDDDDSQTLKICPYPNDGPGRSWLHQAEIWDRASERSRMAAVRHEWTAGWYAPWRLP